MHRADVVISSRLVEGAAEACTRQQWIDASGTVVVRKSMGGAVFIHPSDGFPCRNRKRGGRERKVGDGDFRAATGFERSWLHDDLAGRSTHRDRSSLPSPEVDGRHIVRAFVRYINYFPIVGRLPMRLPAHRDSTHHLVREWIEQLQFARTLYDRCPDHRAAVELGKMRRHACWHLGDHLVRPWVE